MWCGFQRSNWQASPTSKSPRRTCRALAWTDFFGKSQRCFTIVVIHFGQRSGDVEMSSEDVRIKNNIEIMNLGKVKTSQDFLRPGYPLGKLSEQEDGRQRMGQREGDRKGTD